VPVRAQLTQILGLSAHGDADDFVRWVRYHGYTRAASSSSALANRLSQEGLHNLMPRLN